MGSSPRVCPDFFKVYLPDRSVDGLRIPIDFVKHFHGRVPEKAILRNVNGRIWHVGVSQTGKDVRFAKGWQQFVTDNSVKEGDFFVFRYDGFGAFDFKLFGRTQCQKDVDKINGGISQKDFRVKEEKVDVEADRQEAYEEEKEDESEEMEEEEDSDSTEEEMEDVEDTEEEEEMEGEEEEWTEEESSDDEEVELQPKSSAEKVIVCKNKCYSRGQLPGGSNYRGKKPKNDEVSEIGTSNGQRNSRKKCPRTEAEVDYSLAVANLIEIRNPHFKTRLRPRRRSKLYVPVDVLKDHNITLPPKVSLRDKLGKSWPGNVSVWKDGRTWIGGWRSFCKWNHVSENDICICELVQETDSEECVIVVHIHRK